MHSITVDTTTSSLVDCAECVRVVRSRAMGAARHLLIHRRRFLAEPCLGADLLATVALSPLVVSLLLLLVGGRRVLFLVRHRRPPFSPLHPLHRGDEPAKPATSQTRDAEGGRRGQSGVRAHARHTGSSSRARLRATRVVMHRGRGMWCRPRSCTRCLLRGLIVCPQPACLPGLKARQTRVGGVDPSGVETGRRGG